MEDGLNTFLAEWNNDSPTVMLHTSGSTGKPKTMMVEKARMMESAKCTCNFLHLKKGDTALLCLSPDYIAGKMMVVRALVAGLELIERKPCGHPLIGIRQHIDFAAMVPLQVYNSLQTEEECEQFSSIGNVIIGGGAISDELEQQLQTLKGHIWSTYGMTETLSHIAMRAVNGLNRSEYYKPLDGIAVDTNEQNQLVIHAPKICPETIVTNDIVEMNGHGEFKIIGRKDNVICTGGIKVQIEEVEAFLSPYIIGDFAISSVKDTKFGEAVILVVEKKNPDFNTFIQNMPPYWKPKYIFEMTHIPMTQTGKKARAEIKQTAESLFENGLYQKMSE